MAADKYVLRVTAGPAYDLASHVEVPVNSPDPVRIASPLIDAALNVRVRNYRRGLPRSAPRSSPYFAADPHRANADQYSIAFRFRLKRPPPPPPPRQETEGEGAQKEDEVRAEDEDADADADGVPAAHLQFGNDLDHPIRDRLPPGFAAALNILRWWIDPGLDGDPYADAPYLYGPALSSFNAVRVGGGVHDAARGGIWVEEGGDGDGDGDGLAWRRARGAPDGARERMRWALRGGGLDKWVWEYGREYAVDFYNPYIDFGEYALRLPGFNLPVMRYWDGQGLRYVCFLFFSCNATMWFFGLFLATHANVSKSPDRRGGPGKKNLLQPVQ